MKGFKITKVRRADLLTRVSVLFVIFCYFLCAFVHQNSSAYWQGKAENDPLQRVYGISFPDKKMLKEWEHFQAEAAKRDHRILGKVSSVVDADMLISVYRIYSIVCRSFLGRND